MTNISHFQEFSDEFNFVSSRVESLIKADSFKEVASQAAYFDSVFQKSRPSLYGDKYKEAGPPSQEERQENLGRETERTEFFANLGSVEGLKYFMFKMKRVRLKYFVFKLKQVLHFITDTTTESTSPSVEFHNSMEMYTDSVSSMEMYTDSVSEEFSLAVLNAINSQNWEKAESMIMPIAAAFPGRAAIYDAFVVAAVLLLLEVYQYLINLVDRGGGKTYSSGSLEFRSVYISIVLFQGAYVWIKFRDVAPESEQQPLRGVHRMYRENNVGVNTVYRYEPRFKPPGSKVYISVGSYEMEEDARTMYQILAFYYGRKDVQGELPLLDGSTYLIPHMTEEEQRLSPEEKKNWVKGKAKSVFEEYQVKFWGCIMNSETQLTEDILNMVHPIPECPDGGARVIGQTDSSGVQADETHPFQVSNQGADLVPDIYPGNCSPNEGLVAQEVQHHMANVTLGGHVVGDASHWTLPESLPETATNIPANGAAVSREQPLELQQLHHGSWQENQANNSAINVLPDDLSLQRQVKELQRQVQSQQLQLEQLGSRMSQQQHQFQEFISQQLKSQFLQFQQQQQQQQRRLLQSEQRQQLRNGQLESRISALEEELEHLRNPEHARKRSCFGLHAQN